MKNLLTVAEELLRQKLKDIIKAMPDAKAGKLYRDRAIELLNFAEREVTIPPETSEADAFAMRQEHKANAEKLVNDNMPPLYGQLLSHGLIQGDKMPQSPEKLRKLLLNTIESLGDEPAGKLYRAEPLRLLDMVEAEPEYPPALTTEQREQFAQAQAVAARATVVQFMPQLFMQFLEMGLVY